MKKINVSLPFVEFEKEGDSFQGIYLECKEIPSKFGGTQKLWICQATEKVGRVVSGKGKKKEKADIKQGDLVQISEKTTMSNLRLFLEKGEEFMIVYVGEQISEKTGSTYKAFDLYKNE